MSFYIYRTSSSWEPGNLHHQIRGTGQRQPYTGGSINQSIIHSVNLGNQLSNQSINKLDSLLR